MAMYGYRGSVWFPWRVTLWPLYFRLKDDSAVLEAVIWKGTYGRMRVKPEEGLEVIVSGRLTTFPGSSKYQIVVDALTGRHRRADEVTRRAQEETRRRRVV